MNQLREKENELNSAELYHFNKRFYAKFEGKNSVFQLQHLKKINSVFKVFHYNRNPFRSYYNLHILVETKNSIRQKYIHKIATFSKDTWHRYVELSNTIRGDDM